MIMSGSCRDLFIYKVSKGSTLGIMWYVEQLIYGLIHLQLIWVGGWDNVEVPFRHLNQCKPNKNMYVYSKHLFTSFAFKLHVHVLLNREARLQWMQCYTMVSHYLEQAVFVCVWKIRKLTCSVFAHDLIVKDVQIYSKTEVVPKVRRQAYQFSKLWFNFKSWLV